MIVDPSASSHTDVYKLMIGSIVPRPIALVSTLSEDGISQPRAVQFLHRHQRESARDLLLPRIRRPGADPRPDAYKDTLRNISRTREFVVNVVSEEIAEKMNITAGEYPPEVDEFEVAGLTPVPSDLVKPPRVAESHVKWSASYISRSNIRAAWWRQSGPGRNRTVPYRRSSGGELQNRSGQAARRRPHGRKQLCAHS